ncbi:MAG: ABC transporter ATP-binding protein [Solirubrobacterales bacterium]|nr:ABC transporter ATP-binding protein [Solirubrobacterales bacterium]
MIEAPPEEPRELNAALDFVRVELVSRGFETRHGRVQALAGMSLHAAPREVVAVVGPSGCGKSTLLELICKLQKPDAGTIEAGPAALMPQRDLLLPWLSAIDNAALALRARGISRAQARSIAAPWLERFGLARFEHTRPAELSGGMRQRVSFLRTLLAGKPVLALDEPFAALALRAHGTSRVLARRTAAPWLERFGLARFEHARPAELSGGMRQRVSFLRTLLAGKPVLALDEPFAALDAITRQEMQGWLGHVLESEPRTVILVTHDVEEAVMLGDRVVVMSPRPGHTVSEIEVPLTRPRKRTDPAVVDLRERALTALGVQA